MHHIASDVLGCIGNTRILPLTRLAPPHGARVLLKLESENPTGSIKDRMALAMVEAAEANGRLARDGFVVEYSTGNAGIALALVCAVKGYALHVVTSDAYAEEKRDHMRLLGAELHIVVSDSGRMTEKLTRDMIEAARAIAERPGSFWTDQLNNTDQLTAFHAMGEEIWTQTNGQLDAFVQSVGTAAAVRGVGEVLRQHNPRIRIVAVEPAESAVLSGGKSGAHGIDGMGAGFVVPLWRPDVADQIEPVATDDAMSMVIRLAREEGLFAGPTTGANVVAALRVAQQLGPAATVVTVMGDTGMKYLNKLARLPYDVGFNERRRTPIA